MPSSEMLCHVVLVRTDVPEERLASIIGVTRIGEIGAKLSVSSNRRTQRDTRRDIPEDNILHTAHALQMNSLLVMF
jgi:hypothetical protein